MPNDEFYFICPYYRKTMGSTLFCEGISADDSLSADESFVKQCFPDREKRNRVIKKYCTSFKYGDCKIAAVNELFSNQNDL